MSTGRRVALALLAFLTGIGMCRHFDLTLAGINRWLDEQNALLRLAARSPSLLDAHNHAAYARALHDTIGIPLTDAVHMVELAVAAGKVPPIGDPPA